jgi:hypothetical protein
MIFVYIFAALVISVLLIAAFMPKNYLIEKSIIIKKSRADVQSGVSDFNAYSSWNPFQQMEPSASKKITGTPGINGHKYEWQGKKIGTGSLTLNNVDEKHVNIDLQFFKPWKSLAKDNWLFEKWGDGNETKVTWQNTGELPWPMARLMGPAITKNLSHQFEKGLENLKNYTEG